MAERVRMRDCPDGIRRSDAGNMYTGVGANAKTAAYQALVTDCGKAFSNAGAGGSVTITLPADATTPIGWWADFFVTAAQTLVLAATSLNNAATLTAAGSQAGIGMARVTLGPDNKYRAVLVGTWT